MEVINPGSIAMQDINVYPIALKIYTVSTCVDAQCVSNKVDVKRGGWAKYRDMIHIEFHHI